MPEVGQSHSPGTPDVDGLSSRTLRFDVTDEDPRSHAVATVEAEHGHVAVLVNNAGYCQAGAIEETSGRETPSPLWVVISLSAS
jgi:NAD(P)-dependent dehydrogenase (short-subunit alcohol dehydrogenase family)